MENESVAQSEESQREEVNTNEGATPETRSEVQEKAEAPQRVLSEMEQIALLEAL